MSSQLRTHEASPLRLNSYEWTDPWFTHASAGFPEWGLVSAGSGLGNDPTYMRGIATTVEENQVVYEAYFNSEVGGTMLLKDAPQSLNVWKEYFGSGGVAAGRPW